MGAKKPKEETTPLDDALAPLDGGGVSEELRTAVSKVLEKMLATDDLTLVPDEDLASDTASDITHKARIVYSVSLFRLLEFLRKPNTGKNGLQAQAAMALAYVRHAEGRELKALQLGRQRGDDQLAAEVATLREEVKKVSSYRAKLLSEGNGEIPPEILNVTPQKD